MSEVVDMFAWRKEKKSEEKEDQPSSNKENSESSLEDPFKKLMEINAENKRRMEEERRQMNRGVIRSHRLKDR